MKHFRPLFRSTVNYWLVVSILAIGLLVFWRYYRSNNRSNNISIIEIETDTLSSDISDTLHINYANATQLSRFGFQPRAIVNLLKYRDAGGLIRDIKHLMKIRGIDSSSIANKEYLIAFDTPVKIKYYYTPQNTTIHKAHHHIHRVSLYYTPKDSLAALGISSVIIDSIMAYRERYIVHGSLPMDSLTSLTAETFSQVMRGHISERKSYAIHQAEPKKEKPKVDINTASISELCTVSGIGEKTALRIIEHRVMLGGFVALEQLSDIPFIDSVRYAQITPQLSLSTSVIIPLKINEATKNEVLSHPYMRKELGRQLLRLRYRYKKLNREMVIPLLNDTPHDQWLLEYLEF